jgi:hypothetical protein
MGPATASRADRLGGAERGVPAIAHRRDAPKDGQRPGRRRECAGSFEASAQGRPRKITDFLDFRICRCRREFGRPAVPIRTRCVHFFAKARYTNIRGRLCARLSNGGPWCIRKPIRLLGSSSCLNRSKPGRARHRETHRASRVLTSDRAPPRGPSHRRPDRPV